jgi:hypothetical protein
MAEAFLLVPLESRPPPKASQEDDMTLEAFLKHNRTLEFKTQKIKVCDDLPEFEIRELTSEEMSKIRSAAVSFDSEGNSKFNMDLYMKYIVTSATVYPDLRSVEILDSYGVQKPWQLVTKLVPKDRDFQAYYKACMALTQSDSQISFDTKVQIAKN